MEQGDLIGVRFKGNYGTYEFDNIFSTAEPYYMRAGVGTLVQVRRPGRDAAYFRAGSSLHISVGRISGITSRCNMCALGVGWPT